MSNSEQLYKQLWKRASELRRDVELYEECAEHIVAVEEMLDTKTKSTIEMRFALEQIAVLTHYGGLVGCSDERACLNEVRRISSKWLDADKCARLQQEALERG